MGLHPRMVPVITDARLFSKSRYESFMPPQHRSGDPIDLESQEGINTNWARHPKRLSYYFGAGWSSPVAREAHNLEVVGSNPAPATSLFASSRRGNSVKLTAVGYSKQPVSCSNAKHRLFFVFSCNLPRLCHSPETRFPAATLAKTAPLWGPFRDKYSQKSLGYEKRRVNDSDYESSASLGILFFGWSDGLKRGELRTLFKITHRLGVLRIGVALQKTVSLNNRSVMRLRLVIFLIQFL